jgi:hypothetical protein
MSQNVSTILKFQVRPIIFQPTENLARRLLAKSLLVCRTRFSTATLLVYEAYIVLTVLLLDADPISLQFRILFRARISLHKGKYNRSCF